MLHLEASVVGFGTGSPRDAKEEDEEEETVSEEIVVVGSARVIFWRTHNFGGRLIDVTMRMLTIHIM